VQEALLKWYAEHRRDLPWRRTADPYPIWVSEIMLQQTQVQTVLPYFDLWMKRFPSVEALADAEEADVLSAWQGLGYYRRCKLLLAGAKWVRENGIPATADGWRQVPGVGRYTAGAISSIVFGEQTPVVDGNVQRVFSRLTACSEPGKELEKRAWAWAAEHVPVVCPGDWNQALMELGATVCTPRNPSCEVCPLHSMCQAQQRGLVEELPVTEPKRPTIHLRQRVWVPYCAGRVGLRQIPEGQWWAGMWEFPRGTKEVELFPSALRAGEIKHSVTHHRIVLEVFLAEIAEPLEGLAWHATDEIVQIAMPAPQRRALKMALSHLTSGSAR
jgi:A/G-specific adenine glycosylase